MASARTAVLTASGTGSGSGSGSGCGSGSGSGSGCVAPVMIRWASPKAASSVWMSTDDDGLSVPAGSTI